MYLPDKVLVLRIYKEFLLITRIKITQLKMGNNFKDTFHQKTYKWQISV